MAPATTRMKQKLALNKPTKPAAQEPKKTTITRPILTAKSNIKTAAAAAPKTNKPIAASASKPTQLLSSIIIPTNEQPCTSGNRSSTKPASEKKNTARRKHAAAAAAAAAQHEQQAAVQQQRSSSSGQVHQVSTARGNTGGGGGGATNEMQALGPANGSKREIVEYVSNMSRRSIAASMASSMHSRRKSLSSSVDVDAAKTGRDMEAVDVVDDDRGGEGEGEGEEQRERQKEKEKEKQKQIGQIRQMRGQDTSREEKEEDEEEKEVEEAAAGPEEAIDEVDDDIDLDEGGVQADGDGDGDGDGDVRMEEADHDDEEGGHGQEALDHGIDDGLDMHDGSVEMDREGNITMHDAEDEHQTLDFSLQEDLEEDGEDVDMEDDRDGKPEDADVIPKRERKDEVGDGGQSGVEEGSDVEWDGLESPGSAIDEEDMEEEDEEREDEREGEQYEPEESEEEWVADGEAGGEEEGENEEEGEEIEDEEGDQEEGDQAEGDEEEAESEYEDEEGSRKDSADADPPASAEGHEKEGNKSPDEQVKARIYKTVKELVQNIPSRHFVYCRTLDKHDDITHVAFKAYDVDGRMDRFNTQTLQNSPDKLSRLLDVARGIYEKQNGWEFGHLKRNFAFSVPARRVEKKTTKKKTTKAKKEQQAPTHKGLVTISGRFDNEGGEDDRQWDRYIQRLADEAAEILGPSPPVRFKPEPEFMWIWTEKSLFPDYDLKPTKKAEKYAGRLLVILAGLDHEDGEFAFSCENRCHYFEAKMKPCLIATLGDSGAFVNALPLTSGYRIGLVYQLHFTKKDMIEPNTAFNTVDYLNDYEKPFLDGLATWSKAGNMKRNGIHWMVYYILKKQPVDAGVFIPSADLTPAQKLQLTWLCKLCGQMPGKRIGGQVYDWPLLVDLAVLSSCRNLVKETKDGKTEERLGFEVDWTTDADCIENYDWKRDDSAEGMEVKQEEIINFDDFGSTGKDSYLCIRLNIA
ncbi:hypothetical protein QBC32DRAFT_244175 [Pseudoneurospora amorphoporcata]|uniref:Uncharacterized protein n=1 Tax=Pseudoneurospora amorphoporcata TaxID=241081 RepID=A0AAN6NNP7_9PEZI|nr:hypothetical protein QBC32DRAFT_244175 [Pseudoneurospora amorphoporcata]